MQSNLWLTTMPVECRKPVSSEPLPSSSPLNTGFYVFSEDDPNWTIIHHGNECLPERVHIPNRGLNRTESMNWFPQPKKNTNKLLCLLSGAKRVLDRAELALSSYKWKLEKGIVHRSVFEQHAKLSELTDAVKEAQYWYDLIKNA